MPFINKGTNITNNEINNYLASVLYWFVVVDAGSSGSRLRLYSCMKTSENLLSSLEEKYTNTVSIGLQNVLEEYVPRYLTKLFSGLNNTLESLGLDGLAQQNIPVRFYGTAGMRTVSPIVQNRTYSIVTDWIHNNTAFFDIEAKTIPGEYEALYNWLAVNYLNGAFATHAPTAAAFDLGGGSSEIAYETTSTSGSSVFETTIANKTYLTAAIPWFTGNDWSRNQYLDHAGCFNPGYPMPDLRSYSGDFVDCQASVKQPFIINDNLHPMSLSVSFVPQDVHLLSTFYYAYDFLVYQDNSMPASVNFNMSALHLSASQFCSTSWDSVIANPSYTQDDYTNTYCFSAALIEGIYERTQLMELSDNHNLWVTKKINSTSVSWSIGVVAQLMTGTQFNQLPTSTFLPTSAPTEKSHSHASSAELTSSIFIGCAVTGGVMLIALIILAARNSKYIAMSLKSSCAFWKEKNDFNTRLIENHTSRPGEGMESKV